MCQCAVTENRYITDNPPENRMVDGDPLPENRAITRVSVISAVLKRHTPVNFKSIGGFGGPKRISRIIGDPKRGQGYCPARVCDAA